MKTEQLEPISKEFEEAVQQHQIALSKYGENDSRTINAINNVILLSPLWLFQEMELVAHAPRH